MAEQTEYLLSIDLGTNGGELKFRSTEEIEAWIRHEVNFWEWLQKCTSYDNFTRSIWSQQADPWNKANNHIGRFNSTQNPDERTKILKEIENLLRDSYGSGKSLHSSTPQAKKLVEYSKNESNQNDVVTAAYMLGYFIKAPFKINIQRPDSIATIIMATQEAMLFSMG